MNTSLVAIDSPVDSASLARIAEHNARNIAAEREARAQRIDADRIIRAALDLLTAEALDRTAKYTHRGGTAEDSVSHYIAGAAGVPTSRFEDAADAARYVTELRASILAGLSPLAL